MNLKNAVALVTGGGSGLGEATVREFAGAGAKVAILDLPASPGAKVAESLGANALFVEADVASADQVTDAIAKTVAKFASIHIAVNCAGIGRAMRTVTKDGPHPLDLFSKVIAVNLIGTFNVTRLAAAQMAKNQPGPDGERGVIINTASVAGVQGLTNRAVYSAAKGGVVAMPSNTSPSTLPARASFITLTALGPESPREYLTSIPGYFLPNASTKGRTA